ncbi:MAG: hypothetical protein HGA96_06110 [Desulfobulbaceae bacterium]|nr:hypothetical protein [Desulfobulbaceae bacterium]
MAITKFDQQAMAATFAEAGESGTAREILAGSDSKKKQAPSPVPAKKPYLSTLILGLLSLAAYYYVFTNEKLVTDVFTRGGMYAVWPLGTALFVSFIHGAFGSNLLSLLGLEAKKSH